MSARRRGASLLEVLCAGTLSLLLLSTVVAILIPAFRSSGKLAAKVAMEQQISVVLLKITRELQRTRPNTLAYWQGSQGASFCLHTIEGFSLGDPPLPVYSRQLIFYLFSRQRGTLVRAPWPSDPANPVLFDSLLKPPDGSAPLQPDPSSLRAALNRPLRGQQLASSVRLFEVRSPGAKLSNPLTLTLELAQPLPGQALPVVCRLSQVVSIRSLE